jgi:hypothetical protein
MECAVTTLGVIYLCWKITHLQKPQNTGGNIIKYWDKDLKELLSYTKTSNPTKKRQKTQTHTSPKKVIPVWQTTP